MLEKAAKGVWRGRRRERDMVEQKYIKVLEGMRGRMESGWRSDVCVSVDR